CIQSASSKGVRSIAANFCGKKKTSHREQDQEEDPKIDGRMTPIDTTNDKVTNNPE
ncbi:hypothetical protein L9F63_009611, partial [Diploptera punctata]